jgi:hypothetical protein
MFFRVFYRIYSRITWFFYRVSTFKKNLWKLLFPECTYDRFFWNKIGETIDRSFSYVPEDTIHVEQWYRNDGQMKRYVTYSLDPIQFYEGDPFAPVKPAWLWIGNPKDDSLDVTSEMLPYVLPDNLVLPELIERVTGIEEPYYMDARSLDIVKFPAEGIRLERDEPI